MPSENQAPNTVEWIDLDGEQPNLAEQLKDLGGVPVRARHLLLDTNNPVLYRSLEEGIYLSLFGDLISPRDKMADMRGMRLYVTSERIVSVRWGLSDIVHESREMAERRRLNYSGFGLVAVIAVIIARRLSDDIETSARLGEDLEFNPSDYRDMTVDLRELRWNLFRLKRRLDPMATVLHFVSTDPFNQIPQAEEKILRTASDHVELYLKTLASNQARSDLLQEQLADRTNEKIVHSSYRLTIVATIFLPLSFITGLLGMNVAGIPEDHDPNGFYIVSGILLAIGLLSWLILHRKNPIPNETKREASRYQRLKQRLVRARSLIHKRH